MKPLVITASTRMELALLLERSCAEPVPGTGHLQTFRGSIGDREVIIAVTGIGKVNAASAATHLLERFAPALVINTGCGGAFSGSTLGVGDLAVASAEILADEGVLTPEGWQGLDLIGIPVCKWRGERIFNTIPVAGDLAQGAFRSIGELGFQGVIGPFLTVSTCSGTSTQGDELMRRFPGICENMEGAAVAQVALMYQVPFLEIRGISNMVEDRDMSRWDLKGAVHNAQNFLLRFLQNSPLPF